jgi:hypothetical protein
MALPGWRQTTVKLLAEKIGPIADIIVSDVLAELGVTERDMTASHYLQFLRLLHAKLPTAIDRRALCQDLQVAVLKAYGFGKK